MALVIAGMSGYEVLVHMPEKPLEVEHKFNASRQRRRSGHKQEPCRESRDTRINTEELS